MTDVVLINPNYMDIYKLVDARTTPKFPPLGLAYIAGFLREREFSVKILDLAVLMFSRERLIQELKSLQPSVVGFTCFTSTYPEALKEAESIKKEIKNVYTVFGGPHPSALPEETIKNTCVDFVIRGEAELTFLELVKLLTRKRPSGKDLMKIDGLSFRQGNKTVHNQDRKLIKDLDSLPHPARDLLPHPREYYSPETRRRPFTTLITSRGCPYTCLFCSVRSIFGHTYRAHSAKRVVNEIEHLAEKYGVRELIIMDDGFTQHPERVEEICDNIIKRKLDITWKLPNGIRVDKINRELLRKMKKAGCYSVSFGIETGSQKILDTTGKGITLKQIRDAVRMAKDSGLMTNGLFIIGHLGDTEETMQQTIDFAKTLPLDMATFSIMTPYPGTAIYRAVEKNGKFFFKSWEDFMSFSEQPTFSLGECTPELMVRMYKKAYREFFMRPGYIIRRIMHIRSMNDFRNNLNGFSALLNFIFKRKDG